MSNVLDDLLGALREETRQVGRGEVVAYPRPTSTRGTAEGTPAFGRCQADRIREAGARLADGTYDDDDLDIMRDALKVPWNVLEVGPRPYCDDCPWRGQAQTFCNVKVAEDVCDLEGICQKAEVRATHAIRKANGGHVPTKHRHYRPGFGPKVEPAAPAPEKDTDELPLAA